MSDRAQEDTDLAKIQANLEQKRHALDEDELPAALPEPAPRPAPRGDPITAFLNGHGPLPKPNFRTRGLAPAPDPEQEARRLERRIRDAIPDAYHDVSWANLATLRGPEGYLSLGAVETQDGRRLRGQAAVDEIRGRMEGASKVVLLGETRAGKTLVGVAALEAELRAALERRQVAEGGAETQPAPEETRMLWLHVEALKEPQMLKAALSSSFFVLDDLGWELCGAPVDSGWMPPLRAPALSFLAGWSLRRGPRLVVTTFLDHDRMARSYGDGAAARVYEGAEVIQLFLAR